jgi:hypothetical protein
MRKFKSWPCGFLSVIIVSCFAASLPATAQTPPPAWKGKIEIKDGVKIVTNPARPLFGRIALDLEEDLVLGDGVDPNSLFFYRFNAAVDGAGQIYVLDYRSFRVQKFDRTGTFLQTIGKQGQGPAEFQNPTSIWCDEKGNLQVIDDGKVHLFDAAGRYLKSVVTAMTAHQAVVFPDGNMMRMNLVFAPEKFLEEIVLTDGTGKIMKTMASHISQKNEVAFKQKPRFVIDYPEILLSPWTPNLALFAYPTEYQLTAADSQGRIAMIIRRDGGPEEYAARDKNQSFERIIAQYPKEKDNRAELERRTFFPKYRPFFELVRGDADGWIYLRRLIPSSSKDGDREYDIFDREGRFLSTITFSGDECLLDRGFLYTRKSDREKECVKLIRWKIKNWSQIIGGR